ncbi:aspartyl protease BAR1 SCDLUD_002471 [Saccharomycodes ludwigii]|uniref:aspartyl protease BAR1 n=1 Tax=Saccharomycodes ludwigii TaxID=36035 RepID=UPI001E883240|nr:hypothetical protein SCDLUD_002471 [Saccharomycodes ludwigii]KAH3901006.1 hypothetical protein SCDLUD_002471 [Saccharomycodes ludwigii]
MTLSKKKITNNSNYNDSKEKRCSEKMALQNQGYFFSTSLKIGSPVQTIEVLVDTGSSDLFISSTSNPYCGNICQQFGAFNPNNSESYKELPYDFFSYFGDGTVVNGTWASETITLDNGNKLPDLQFGLVTTGQALVSGVLGLGLTSLESVVNYENCPNLYYDNFPASLSKNGLIASNSYSIQMFAETSSIIFGGVDLGLIEDGFMFTYPLISDSRFAITMQSLKSAGKTIIKNKVSVYLDTGTTTLTLPQNYADSLASTFNATWDSNQFAYMLPTCVDKSRKDIVVEVNFGDITINIESSDMIAEQDGQCALNLLPTNTNQIILGDPFFLNAYTVFDLDNREISIAKLNKDPFYSSVKDITYWVPGAIKGWYYGSTAKRTFNRATTTTILSVNTAANEKYEAFKDIEGFDKFWE